MLECRRLQRYSNAKRRRCRRRRRRICCQVVVLVVLIIKAYPSYAEPAAVMHGQQFGGFPLRLPKPSLSGWFGVGARLGRAGPISAEPISAEPISAEPISAAEIHSAHRIHVRCPYFSHFLLKLKPSQRNWRLWNIYTVKTKHLFYGFLICFRCENIWGLRLFW